MTQDEPGWDDRMSRAVIDGRVAFGTAVFLLGSGMFILLDRIGAPERLVALLGPLLAVVGLATIGFLLRSMRISSFYAAGRAAPGGYAGLAMTALMAALAAPLTPPIPLDVSPEAILLGLGAGLALAALGFGPLLRKTGAFSITHLLAARFPYLALRIGSLLMISLVGLCIGLAGLTMALRGLAQATGFGHMASTMLGAGLVALIVVPGGVSGLLWTAVAAGGLLIASVAAPLVVLIASGATIPLPMLGDKIAFEQAMTRIGEWQAATSQHGDHEGAIIMAMALGLAALAPLLAPAIATPGVGEARRGGLIGVGWCALLTMMTLAVMAATTLTLQSGLVGMRLADLPAFVLEASTRGVMSLCGRNPATLAQARAACEALPGHTGALGGADIAASGDYLLMGLAQLRGFGPSFSGLAMAGRISVALVLSAAGFLTLATALGNDAFYRMREGSALTSRRLAVTRLMLLGAIAAAAAILLGYALNPRPLIGLALGVSAVTVTPLLLLALWPRATGQDATIGLIAGLAFAEIFFLFGGAAPGLGLTASAVVAGSVAATLAGFAASFLHAPDPTSRGQTFLHGLLHRDGDVLGPDKGA